MAHLLFRVALGRCITDLNWCPFNDELLATSSIDTFVHIWDIRDGRSPTLSLSSVGEETIEISLVFVFGSK